ncbi:MAG: hypothetical protein K9J37_20500 [Saprospiraceae bacterium]|nr:hypothetical protein [Saprospiraceae bacterium]MCF8252306.1 hypothetical protein [Saprospiraceae bacterium]MCF8282164.1 hypothetical protein [Bacteroidales bacterium]MCF8313948.1 hypothetical protein [Saprospiraceae bacterium]MCF8442658.1 hypothetical protein [Saprospiraceae bacterium]
MTEEVPTLEKAMNEDRLWETISLMDCPKRATTMPLSSQRCGNFPGFRNQPFSHFTTCFPKNCASWAEGNMQHIPVPAFAEHLPENWLTNVLLGEFYRQAKNLPECARHYQIAQQKAPTTALKKLIHRKMLSLTTNKKGGKKKVKW